MTDWGIIASRILQFGPALVLFGAPLFLLYGIPTGSDAEFLHKTARFRPAVVVCAVLVACGAAGWVLCETLSIYSDPGAFTPDAVWTVLGGTGFGRAAFLRIVMAAAAAVLLMLTRFPGKTQWIVQAILGAVVLISFAWTGHGVKDEGAAGVVHLTGDIVHLLSAGVWAGALFCLAVLLIVRRRGDEARIAQFGLDAFSWIGVATVALVLFSGIVNSWFLVGPVHILHLLDSSYGVLLGLKLLLFAAMLGLAAANRYRFAPRFGAALARPDSGKTGVQAITRSVQFEAGLALLILIIVSWMGTLEPPA